MRTKLLALTLLTLSLYLPSQGAFAQQAPVVFPPNEYFVGRITEIVPGRQEELLGAIQQFLNIKVQILSGELKGSEIIIEDEDRFAGDASQGPQVGDKITVVKFWLTETDFVYHVDDRYRLPALSWIF